MEFELLDIEERLAVMRELLTCGTNIDLWCYGADGHIIDTTSKHLVLDTIFEHTGQKAAMLEYSREHTEPLVLGGELGLMWCSVSCWTEGTLKQIYVLGPVFHTDISMRTIEQSVKDFNIDLSWRTGYIHLLSQLPVVSSVMFLQYALMLHCCLTGEHLTRSDIQFQQNVRREGSAEPAEQGRMGVWMAERALLRMVSEGDLNYQEVISNANLLSNGVRAGENQPILQAIVSCTTFTSLCVREAIGAGLSPETAYSVGDSYIQSMLECKTVPDLRSINHAMYEDFIMRVHKLRTNPDLSPQIRACRDYIELHAGEELSLAVLAKYVRYSEYYLSRKFKKEMGLSVTEYIRLFRVERAKTLLVSTTMSLREISDSLRFCSWSHFTSTFRDRAGMTPAEYRAKYQRL